MNSSAGTNQVLQLLEFFDCQMFIFAHLFQIKALISAPATESAPTEGKKPAEEAPPSAVPAAEAPTVAPRPKPAPKVDNTKMVKALGLLGKRVFDKFVPVARVFTLCVHFLSNV